MHVLLQSKRGTILSICVCLASSTSRFDIDIKGVEMNTFSWHLEYLTVINVFRIYFVHSFLSSIYLFRVQPFENDFLRNTMDPIRNHHSERIKCSHHIVFLLFLLSGDSMKVGPSNVKFVLSHSWASSSFLQNLFYQLFIRRKCHVKFVKLVPTCVTNGRLLSFFSNYECSRWRSNRLYNGPLQMGKNKNNGNYFRKNLPWKFYYAMFRPANRNSEKKVVGLLHRLH